MKKKLILITVAVSLVVGLVLLTHKSSTPSYQNSQTTETPISAPTPKKTSADTDLTSVELPTQEPAADSQPPDVTATPPLLDIDSSDYVTSDATSIVSDPFTPSQNTWSVNVDYTCAENKTNLVVYLMVEVPKDSKPTTANIYHLVQTKNTRGNYSFKESKNGTFYFRVSGGCNWHVTVLDSADMLYGPIEPCTTGQQAAIKSPANHIPDSCGR